jgi:hypothetical protein
MNGFNKGVLVASAAATLLLAGAVAARAADKAEGKVHCAGINACKGQGACAGAGNACGGQNACKGQGITQTTEEECKAKGGKVVQPKM